MSPRKYITLNRFIIIACNNKKSKKSADSYLKVLFIGFFFVSAENEFKKIARKQQQMSAGHVSAKVNMLPG